MSSKAKRLTRGSVLQTLRFFVDVAITLAMMPFIIHSLGDRTYGLWIVIGTFLGYYWLLDFGLCSAAERYISRNIGINDTKETNIIINTSLFLYTLCGLVALGISLLLAYLLPFFHKNISDIILFRQVIIILGLNFAFAFPMRIFSGILRAHLLFDFISIIDMIKFIIRNLLIYYFLKQGHGILALAFITLGTDVASRLFQFFWVKKIYRDMMFSPTLIKREKFKELFEYGGFTFISQIADQLRFNIDNLVITILLGLNLVTIYSIAIRLITYFQSFIGSTLGIFMPVFSQYEGKGDYDSIREKFLFFIKISGYASLAVGSLLIIFGKVFIQRWIGIRYEFAYTIMLALVFAVIVSLMQRPICDLLFGISKHRFLAVINITEGVSNLILSIILAKKIGLIGVALGTAIPLFITQSVILPFYSCRSIGLSFKRYLRECIVDVFVKGIFILSVSYLLYRNFIKPNYTSIFCLVSLHLLLFVSFVFLFGFNENEMGLFRKVLQDRKNWFTEAVETVVFFRKTLLGFIQGGT